jgi:hypothetical protein
VNVDPQGARQCCCGGHQYTAINTAIVLKGKNPKALFAFLENQTETPEIKI